MDVRLGGGRIEAVGTAGSLAAPGSSRVDLNGFLLLPAPAEPHAHSDTALTASARDGPVSYAVEEVQRRATEAALLQLGHGATALRSHVRIDEVQRARPAGGGAPGPPLAARPHRPRRRSPCPGC